jgi:hypothetical protein
MWRFYDLRCRIARQRSTAVLQPRHLRLGVLTLALQL